MVSALISSFGAVVIKTISAMDASVISWFRMTIPTIILGCWLKYSGVPLFRGNMKKMLSASALNAVRLFFFFIAFIYTSIGNAVILCYTWPLFVVILSYFFLGERLTKKQILLIVLAFLGLCIAYSEKEFSLSDKDFLGMMSAILAALMYSVTVIIFKSESNNYSRNEMIFYQNLTGMFLYVPFFIKYLPEANFSDVALASCLGLFIGIVGFNFFFYGLKILKASVASSIMYLDVVCAIFLSWVVFGEFLSATMIVGGLMIIFSSYMITRRT